MLVKPDATYSDDLYRVVWPDGVEMILERFNEARDDIACELTVRSSHSTKGGTLVDGKRLLLIGANSQRDMAKLLSLRDEEPDWAGMLEQVTTLARRRYRQGEPPTDLRDEVSTSSRYLVRPLVIGGGTTVWFGSEESAKSMMAMAVAVAVASGREVAGLVAETTGPVVYLDWEDDASTHNERLHAICAGAGIDVATVPIWHQRMTASLSEASRDIRRIIAELGAVFAIIDSIGMASGGDPADAGGIIKTMTATRVLGVDSLGIHHLPKEAKDKSRPYGSVYAAAEARMTWLIEKDEDATPGSLRIALTNKKSNRSTRHPRMSFEMRFRSDENREALESVTIEPIGFMESVSIGTGAAQKWKILDAIKGGARTIDGISAATGIAKATTRMQLNRHRDLFAKSSDGLQWGLLDQREAESESVGESVANHPESVIQGVSNQGGPFRAPDTSLIRGHKNDIEEEGTSPF